jgi:hypothetical protein
VSTPFIISVSICSPLLYRPVALEKLVGTPFMVTGVLEMVATDAPEKIAASIPFMGMCLRLALETHLLEIPAPGPASITDYQRRGCKTG